MPHHLFIVVYLPAGMSHDLWVKRVRQASKNDRHGPLYPNMPSNRPNRQSSPGGCCRIFAVAALGLAKTPVGP